MIHHETALELEEATRKRIEKMRLEFSQPPELKAFENTERYNQIIAQVNIPVLGLCEHHHVGFPATVNIAYIPSEWLLGLSKFARVAEFYLNPTRPTLQERATQQIMNHLQEALMPKGLMVVIKAEHGCCGYRGVKKQSLTITSAVKGLFETDMNARLEFLTLTNN